MLSRMLNAKYKTLLVKMFSVNNDSAAVALRKYRDQKNVKSWKRLLKVTGLLKFILCGEETGTMEDLVWQ